MAGCAILLAAIMAVDLVTGPSQLTAPQVFAALADGPEGGNRAAAAIIWAIRLPMTFMGALVGMGLGIAGLQMQTILDNPLASPFTLGFSAAAGFGAALAIMFGGILPIAAWIIAPISAFAMTLVASGLIYLIARWRSANAEILVLAGIAVMFMFQACQSLLHILQSRKCCSRSSSGYSAACSNRVGQAWRYLPSFWLRAFRFWHVTPGN